VGIRSIILIVLLAAYVYAQSGATTDIIDTGRLTETGAGNATAQAGNVTMINLSSTSSTTRWQGFYGNVSGSLSLGLGNDILYDFSNSPSAVYVSRNQSFDFTSIETGDSIDIDAVWGFSGGADTAAAIFTDTTTLEGVVAPCTELEPTGSNFNTTIMDMGANYSKTSFAFGVQVQEPAIPCFDNTECEFEVMVPVTGTEVYYFFLSI